MRFRVDSESLVASGQRGDHARLGMMLLQASADEGLRERLRQQWLADRSKGIQLRLLKLALRARVGDATTPVPVLTAATGAAEAATKNGRATSLPGKEVEPVAPPVAIEDIGRRGSSAPSAQAPLEGWTRSDPRYTIGTTSGRPRSQLSLTRKDEE